MSIKDAMYDHLLADVGVSAEVDTRVSSGYANEGETLPYIVIDQASGGERFHHMTAAAGLVKVVIQLNLYTAGNLGLEALIEAVRAALDGFRGNMGTPSVNVRMCHLRPDFDALVPASNKSTRHTFHRAMRFEIAHTETVPTFA